MVSATSRTSTSPDPSRLLSTRDFADLVGVTPETIRRYVRDGLLGFDAHARLRGRLRFRADQVDELLQARTQRSQDLEDRVAMSIEKMRRIRKEQA